MQPTTTNFSGLEDIRLTAESIQHHSQEAIGRLDAMIARGGEFLDLATMMREVCVDFQKLADGLHEAYEICIRRAA